jgi:hypothetical protein
MRGGSAMPDRKITQMARTTPYYERNRAKPCSFWLKGTCTRVTWGDCPYRPCNGDFRFPELNGHPGLNWRHPMTMRPNCVCVCAMQRNLLNCRRCWQTSDLPMR